MTNEQIYSYSNPQMPVELRLMADSPAIMKNRLEALTVLINSILFEVEVLKQNGERNSKDRIDFDDEVEKFEADLIRCALMRAGGKQRRAAAFLNMKVTTLNAKIKRLGIATSGLFEDESCDN